MLVWFPAYQFFAIISVAAINLSFIAVDYALFLVPLALILLVILGVPILASWHLSCLLFGVGYFGFLARLGIPAMSWMERQVEGPVNWFRPKSD